MLKEFSFVVVVSASVFGSTIVALSDDFDEYRVECTPGQKTAIVSSIAKAKSLLGEAISSLPPVESSVDNKITRWFGVHDDGDVNELKQTYSSILGRLTFTSYWCPNASFPDDGRDEGTFAWVPASSVGEMFLEPRFFSSGTSGVDSQSGTIIHEVSHLVGSVDSDVSGDGKPDYGIANAEQLARTRPTDAKRTGDNLQYFVEDLVFGI